MAVPKQATQKLELSANLKWKISKFSEIAIGSIRKSDIFAGCDYKFHLTAHRLTQTNYSLWIKFMDNTNLRSLKRCECSIIDMYEKERFSEINEVASNRRILTIKSLNTDQLVGNDMLPEDTLTIRCVIFIEDASYTHDATEKTGAKDFLVSSEIGDKLSKNNIFCLPIPSDYKSQSGGQSSTITTTASSPLTSKRSIFGTPVSNSTGPLGFLSMFDKASTVTAKSSKGEFGDDTSVFGDPRLDRFSNTLPQPGYFTQGSSSAIELSKGCHKTYVEQGVQTEVTNFSGYRPPDLSSALSADFARIYENETDTDCVLKASNKKFLAHRVVLSARSAVFAAMFHHDTSECINGEANIEDVDASTLDNILHYIYSGKICGLASDTAVPMFIAADKYALLELRDECLQFLLCNLDISNICDAAILAHVHGEIVLESKVVNFIDDHLDQVLDSEVWKTFFANKPVTAGKYICAAYRNCKNNKR